MKRILNAAVILLTVLLSASLPVSAEQSQVGVNAAASTIVVRGKVVDEKNEPFAGVSIVAKKATNGVITGVDGTFEINVLKDDELEFSFLGYTNLIEKIDGRPFYLVTMRPQTSELEQVTVVAYGKQRKESVIGAISSMNVDKITHSVSKLSNVLAGQMAGVVAVQRSGEPGEGSDFWIRGVSTFGANNRPLVLVDGIERDLNLVDPDDVETFSILKDATATAIYGVRGANGVVLITTRKGKEASKPVISGRVEASLLQPTKMPKMANAKQFMYMYNFAFEDNKGGVFYTEEAKAKYLDGSDPDLYPNINWMDEIYKDVTTSYRVNVNVTGGSKKVQYYVAGSYYRENGIFSPDKGLGYNPSNNWSRFNFRSNLDIKLFPYTTLNINLSNQYDTKRQPNNNYSLWIYTFKTIPIAIPKRYSDGTIARPTIGENPYNLLNLNGYNEIFTNNAQSLIGLTQDFEPWVKGLKANVKFSWDAVNYAHLNRSKNPSTYYASGRDENGNLMFTKNNDGNDYLSLYRDNSGHRTTYLEASVTYDRQFVDAHRVGALFLYNMKERKDNFPGNYIASLPYRNLGIAGRLTYSYRDRYFVEGNFGYNGSENFAPSKRFGFFPSVALAWRMNEENFLKNVEQLSNLKLRLSYGISGNSAVSAYQTQGGLGKTMYAYLINNTENGAYGYYPALTPNYNLGWEKTATANIGIDFGFFNNRISGSLDIYQQKTSDLLMQKKVPSSTGYSLAWDNVGKTENKGVELVINTQNFNQKDFSWNTDYTFTLNREKITELADGTDRDISNGWFVRHSIKTHYGLEKIGIWQLDEAAEAAKYGEKPGRIKIKDQNKDGSIDNDNDRIILGSETPDFVMGLNNTFKYKNFDLRVFMYWRQGQMLHSEANGYGSYRIQGDPGIKVNYWTPENPTNEFPRPEKSYSDSSKLDALGYVDGSYLKIKEITLGYQLPKSWIGKIHASNIRIYCSLKNFFTFSHLDNYDPERGGSLSYPMTKQAVFGINVDF